MWSLVAAAVLVALKLGTGIVTGSLALISAGIESSGDVIAALLTLVAFVLVVAAYVPGNGIKAWLKDPMILGVKTWAFAHLLANGALADVVLFGSFLAWAVLDFRAVRQRRRAGREPTVAPAQRGRSAVTVIVGVLAWMLFAFHLHLPLIGVQPISWH